MENKSLIFELERIFEILNQALFDGELKPINFSFQPKKKVSLRWMSDTMVVGAELSKLEYWDIPSIMLHEMVHVLNFQNKNPDVTVNQYHNKNFLQVALDVGFVVIKHKSQGWAITTTVYPRNVVERAYIKRPNKNAVRRRESAFNSIVIDKAILREGRLDMKNRVKREKPAKTFFLKYQCKCPPPHNSIRSGRRPDGPNAPKLMCLDCKACIECVTELDE